MNTIHGCPECGEPHYRGQARQQRIRQDGLRAEICRLRAEIDRLRERLPTTKDGLVAVPSEPVYHPSNPDMPMFLKYYDSIDGPYQNRYRARDPYSDRLLLISECYSTDEAAAEAGEAEDGSGGLG